MTEDTTNLIPGSCGCKRIVIDKVETLILNFDHGTHTPTYAVGTTDRGIVYNPPDRYFPKGFKVYIKMEDGSYLDIGWNVQYTLDGSNPSTPNNKEALDFYGRANTPLVPFTNFRQYNPGFNDVLTPNISEQPERDSKSRIKLKFNDYKTRTINGRQVEGSYLIVAARQEKKSDSIGIVGPFVTYNPGDTVNKVNHIATYFVPDGVNEDTYSQEEIQTARNNGLILVDEPGLAPENMWFKI